jgi:hypothetical protein
VDAIPAALINDLGYTLANKSQALARRIVLAYSWAKNPQRLTPRAARDLEEIILRDLGMTYEGANSTLNKSSAKQLGIGPNFPPTLKWQTASGADLKKVSLTQVRDFLTALHERAGG